VDRLWLADSLSSCIMVACQHCVIASVRYPIVQSGMGRVAGPELAAEVSRAGGLGILAALNLSPEELRAQIRRVRELTDRPFGVNLWLHPDLMPPIDPGQLPAEAIDASNAALNRVRRAMGLRESNAPPRQRPDTIAAAIDTILDERVPVWSTALGLPEEGVVARCRERGVQLMVMVANLDDARAAAMRGADFIVAQGFEAGGHRSVWRASAGAGVGTLALVPEIVDAVDVPVIAAGGVADGRGLVASRALGAAGVLMGTRFVATRESMAPEFWKLAILKSASSGTMVTTAFTGLPARLLQSRLAGEYESSRAPVLPGLLQAALQQDIWTKALSNNDPDYYPLYAGQSVGVIHDVPGAADVVASIVEEANAVIRQLTAGL
jgi:nitronate monooxygenase